MDSLFEPVRMPCSRNEMNDGRLLEADGDTAESRKYRWDLDLKCIHRYLKLTVTQSPVFSFRGALWKMRMVNGEHGSEIFLMFLGFSTDITFDEVHWMITLAHLPNFTAEGSTKGYRSIAKGPVTCTVGMLLPIHVSTYLPFLSVKLELRLKSANKNSSFETVQKQGTAELVSDLKQLLLSGVASDATIQVKGSDFQVHRSILAARTPIFASMFKHEMSERETGLVKIDDCESETFQRFLQYVYTGAVEDLNPVDASALYKVADKYQVDGLKANCLEVLKKYLSVDSFCNTFAFAHLHLETELLRMTTEFFSNNFKEILPKVEWQEFLTEHPILANELLIKAFVNTPPVTRWS